MKKAVTLILVGVLLGSTAAFAASKIFSDVPSDAWYADAANSLSDKGIIVGYKDGTFGPTNNVNRAELAVMLDRLIEYMETGEVSSSESNEIAFDACSDLTTYKNHDWFDTLNQKYVNEFLAPYGESGNVGGEFAEGCLSLDDSLFIFIPLNSESDCKRIFSYNTTGNVLKTPDNQQDYCATEFGQRVDDYVEFTGSQGIGSEFDGKYYFLENKVEN